MTSPTSKRQKQDRPPFRLKLWCARLALAAMPCYLMALFSVGTKASQQMVTPSATTPHPLLSRAPLRRCPPGASPKDCRTESSSVDATRRRKRRLDSESSYPSIAREIAAKWNLTSPEAPYLLEQQFYRANDYNPDTDFLHFYHIAKTGGTTLSDILNDTLGALVDGHRGILPGSERSGPLRRETFFRLSGIPPNRTDAEEAYSFPYRASYGHTRLRPIHGPNKTQLASFFEEYFALPGNSPKRLRALGMLREPMNLRASTHAMAMCGLNGQVNTFNWHRHRKGLKRICTPEQGLNISELIDETVEKAIAEKCPNGAMPSNATKLHKHEALLCSQGRSALDLCRSPTQLLNSAPYQKSMRSMLRTLQWHPISLGGGPSAAEVERYTLIDLGGLDADILHTADGVREESRWFSSLRAEPDFVWFGITERMKESVCLLYYTLDVMPLKKTPRSRVMQCSPTSWWSEEHREEVKRREPEDYAVWRAANAILDVRVLKMQDNLRNQLKNGRGAAQKKETLYKAMEDAGCLDIG